MTPYYSEAGITIYHGDCREVLPSVTADVMVTDPPYGMAYDSGWRTDNPVRGDRGIKVRDDVLMEWGARPAIVFGGRMCPRPVTYREVLVWDKGGWPGMGDLSFPWGPSHEEVYVLGTAFSGPRRVLRHARLTGTLQHPTEKPLGLITDLVAYTIGTILDPFMGSGTTLRAAKDLGRRAIGIEIEEKYCEIAANRLRQEVLPL